MAISTDPPRGTRDFFPDDMLARNWLIDTVWKETAKRYNYREYDSSIVEHADLWDRKDGSDIHNEMYIFEKEGVKLALRPEMTPTLARMVIACNKAQSMPMRWFSVPQCWRYETTARGRKREFYQLNVDIFGGDRIKSEIEIFSMIVDFLKKVKLTSTDVVIRVSNRMILQRVLEKMNVTEENFPLACSYIDKIDKLDKKDFCDLLTEKIGLTKDQIDIIFKIVKIKNINELRDYIGDDPVIDEMNTIFSICKDIGISEWLELDLSVVRGLSYYTGIIFEGFFKNSDMKRAILGGGRYDNLLSKYGAENIPAIGFGLGDVVIMDVLNEKKLVPKFTHTVDYIVIPFNFELYGDAMRVSNKIREALPNCKLETYMGKDRLKTAYGYADRIGAKFAVLLAPTEWATGKIIVKDLRSTDKDKGVAIKLDKFISDLKTPYFARDATTEPCDLSDSDVGSFGSGA
jgi:histidyl-tRNA synthetase